MVREMLYHLSKKLKDLYKIIFQSILNCHQDDFLIVERALKWLLYGKAPFYTSDFITAVSTNPYSRRASLSKESLLRLCRNLVEEEKHLDRFRIAHLSVKTLLEKRRGFVPTKVIHCLCQLYITCPASFSTSCSQ